MCETKQHDGKQDERSADQAASQGGGCPCDAKRCLPFAGVVLGAVAVGLVVGALRRSRQKRDDEARGGRPAGCCG